MGKEGTKTATQAMACPTALVDYHCNPPRRVGSLADYHSSSPLRVGQQPTDCNRSQSIRPIKELSRQKSSPNQSLDDANTSVVEP